MTLAISILILLAVILFVVRFVRSRFQAASDMPEDVNDDPRAAVPVLRKGGPKDKTSAAAVEEPDE